MARRERPASGGWRQLLRQMRLSLCAFAVLAALAAAGILMLRSAMLRNARDTGTALAASCAAEARGRLAVFETLLTFGTASLDQRLAEEQDRAATEAWLALYFQRVHTVLGSGVVDPYAVLDGEIVAANPWEGDADYDYAAAPWYRQAVAAGGEVIFTQVYTDAISGRPVVTAAQLCRGSGAIMAFDLLPENLRIEAAVLEEGDSLFLCDGAGTLLYRQTDLDVPQETLQAYVTGLVERIAGGTLDDDPSVHDLDGQRRGVYYARMDNGWYAILTVPYRRILGGLQGAVWLLLAMFAVSFAAVAALNRRELRLSAGIRRANETVRVLGNTYYALYRVDYTRETYEMIKGSEYVRSRIPPSGPYDALLRTAGEVIEEEAFRDFTESFSCENIRQLVRRRVRDFGGEFLRRFGGTYRWVSVRVLYDASLAPGEVVLCFREVEREKQGQLQERRLLEESLRLARQNEASRQAFFRNMSHDMRTPINAILSAGQLARQHLADPARTAGYLEKIEASGWASSTTSWKWPAWSTARSPWTSAPSTWAPAWRRAWGRSAWRRRPRARRSGRTSGPTGRRWWATRSGCSRSSTTCCPTPSSSRRPAGRSPSPWPGPMATPAPTGSSAWPIRASACPRRSWSGSSSRTPGRCASPTARPAAPAWGCPSPGAWWP